MCLDDSKERQSSQPLQVLPEDSYWVYQDWPSMTTIANSSLDDDW